MWEREREPVHDGIQSKNMAAETKVLHQSAQAMQQEAVSLSTVPVQVFEHEKAPPIHKITAQNQDM